MNFAALSKKRKALLGSAAKQYHESLDDNTLDYFRKRGLDEEDLKAFRIGTVVEPFEDAHEVYVGRAVLPYMTPTGVVNLKFRCIEDHACKEHGHQKYYALSGNGTHLYNVLALHKDSNTVAITEGEIDAITVQQRLGIPTLAYPGADQWMPKTHWPSVFEGYSTVYVIADGDKPGRDAAKQVAGTMTRNSKIVYMPDGEDANSYLLTEEGQEWLAKRLKGSRPET